MKTIALTLSALLISMSFAHANGLMETSSSSVIGLMAHSQNSKEECEQILKDSVERLEKSGKFIVRRNYSCQLDPSGRTTGVYTANIVILK
ncbi:MAG: hypothetical protein CME71_04635 [Halobacteriovorax sp.]|nr:hypothetical protein [Halobacteriovorax sp.]